MTMTRRTTRLLMRELSTPAAPPADAVWLFARDDGGGTTLATVEFASGALQNLTDGTGGGGGGGTGGEYINVQRDYAGNLASALGAAHSGDVVFMGGASAPNTYTVGGTITVPAGVHLMGSRMVGESNYSTIASSSTFGANPLLKLMAGASAVGINVNATTGAATHAIQCAGDAVALEHMTTRGGTQFGVMNLPGTGHQRWSHLRNMGGPTQHIMQVNGDHNMIISTVSTGVNGGHPTWFTGNYNIAGPAHWTGDSTCNSTIRVDGHGNTFFSVWGDTIGTNSRGHFDIRDGFNTFINCGAMNVGLGLQRPLVAITAKDGTNGSKGNMFFGVSYSKTGSKDPVTLAAKFFDASGNPTTNKALFRGTRIYWNSGVINPVGGSYHNLTGITTGDGIDIVGTDFNGTSVPVRT